METILDVHATTPAIALLNKPQGRISEPLDCSPPPLDLSCTRRKRRSPSPEGASYHTISKREQQVPEAPTSTMYFHSPESRAESESSETSVSSDPMREYPPYSFNGITGPKMVRPFKAYQKGPLPIALGVASPEDILTKDSSEAYAEYRSRFLSQWQQNNNKTNKNMRRNTVSSSNPQNADPSYWEKRRKNNEAAKRSRDARRAKEDEIAIRCAFLEQENITLRYEVARLTSERQRCAMYH